MRHTRDADQNETTNGQPEIKAIVCRIGSSADSPNSNNIYDDGAWLVQLLMILRYFLLLIRVGPSDLCGICNLLIWSS